jgi:hypothetical protein
MGRNQQHPLHTGCGPDCTYRGLYEGTQASLADMARRQTEALRRVGRLRSAIVLLLKRHFPQAFTQAETNIGGRLSEADDEVLLAYLSGFVGSNASGSSEQHVQLMRKVAQMKSYLQSIGIPVVDDDPASWIEAINLWKTNLQLSSASKVESSPAQSTPVQPAPPALRQSESASTKQQSPEVSSVNTTVLGDLFDAARHTGRNGQREHDTSANVSDLGDVPAPDRDNSNRSSHAISPLAELFNDIGSSSAGTTRTRSADSPGSGTVGNSVDINSRDILQKNITNDTLGDIFGPDISPPARWEGPLGDSGQDTSGRWSPSPIQPRNLGNDEKSATHVTSSQINDEAEQKTKTEWVNPFDPPTTTSSLEIDEANINKSGLQSGESVQPVDGLAPTFVTPGTSPMPDRKNVTLNLPDGDDVSGVSTVPLVPTQTNSVQGLSQPLRPELFTPTRPSKTTRRGGKQPRARAERPDPHLLDVPVDDQEQGDLSADVREKILAACLLPRPVFTSDLVAVAGSNEVVAAWESDLRAEPASSPVRFLAAKGRHRLRGSLIVPVNDGRELVKNTKNSWWAECVDLYRGSRLYELGVVLHRVGDEIVAYRFGEHTAVLRLSSPRGLVGVVITFDNAVGEEPTKSSLRADLDQLLKERLTLIAVLTTAGESSALSNVTETVASLALSEKWSRTIPVIAARSWEFADDRGSTAQLVFGG